jgi:hypothetical protein
MPETAAGLLAGLGLLTALLAAPLVLGTQVVLRRAGRLATLAWLGLLVLLLLGALGGGAAGLVLSLL